MDSGKPPGCRKSAISCKRVGHTAAGCHDTDCCEEETDKGKAIWNNQHICLRTSWDSIHKKTDGTCSTLGCVEKNL